MPELPGEQELVQHSNTINPSYQPRLTEVERAAKLIRDSALNRTIKKVETSEDTIVYEGISHTDFANELTGRKLLDVKRHGKVFYFILDGDGRMPVMHFGMTGMVQVKGQEPTWYQQRPKDQEDQWPPRFMKFVIHFATGEEEDSLPLQLAFRDARRLGRIRLCASPTEEPPISALGFDPILSMPSIDDFTALVKKRNMPIKALLLDQAFSAGVGNWVADEVLFHARIHPEARANALESDQMVALHEKIIYVCQTAVGVNADASQFPPEWLFLHRWGKGKKGVVGALVLPNGEKAKIKWIKVGGRTSAIVEQVQKLSIQRAQQKKRKRSTKRESEEDEPDESELSDPPSDPPSPVRSRKRAAGTKSAKDEDEEPVQKTRRTRRNR